MFSLETGRTLVHSTMLAKLPTSKGAEVTQVINKITLPATKLSLNHRLILPTSLKTRMPVFTTSSRKSSIHLNEQQQHNNVSFESVDSSQLLLKVWCRYSIKIPFRTTSHLSEDLMNSNFFATCLRRMLKLKDPPAGTYQQNTTGEESCLKLS